jgi:7,8-dihydropterin-6-yl-methyl-4-(beta-D-ribofuranosyl)aminobenzene 5'-phosphate synthase
MKTSSWLSYLVSVFAVLLPGCAATTPPQSAATSDLKTAQITVLYDAFGKTSAMTKDWGFAALIEYGGKRILFDTGNNADIFAHNVKAKGIDLTKLDFVVISHRHGDHTSGLNYLLSVNPNVLIYAPREQAGVFGASANPGTLYRRNESLPPEMSYFDGKQPQTLRFGTPWPQAHFTWVTQTAEVAPGFHLILLKGSWGVDLDVMELSLAIDTPDGVVLVVGCSHPTIEKIVEATKATVNKSLHLVVAGTHLLRAKDDEIQRIAVALRDNWKVEWIARRCRSSPKPDSRRDRPWTRRTYAPIGRCWHKTMTARKPCSRASPIHSGSCRLRHLEGWPEEHKRPNKGLQATANSQRSYVASAIGGA